MRRRIRYRNRLEKTLHNRGPSIDSLYESLGLEVRFYTDEELNNKGCSTEYILYVVMFLEGNPNLPTLPSTGVSLCSNGIYIIDADGQNIITPIMPRIIPTKVHTIQIMIGVPILITNQSFCNFFYNIIVFKFSCIM